MAFKAITLLAIFSFSFANYSRYGGELFADSQNARNAAMGGINISISDGLNPALLTFNNEPMVQFSHKSKFGGLANVSQATYLNTDGDFPLLFSLVSRYVDQIPDTRQAWDDDGGSPESGNINYLNISEFSQNEFGVKIGTLLEIRNYKIGLLMKPFYSKLSSSFSYGHSVDVSLLLNAGDRSFLTFRVEDLLGFGFRHWNSGITEINATRLIFGGWRESKDLLLGAEVGFPLERPPRFNYHLGIEYQKFEKIVFRCGHSSESLFSFGLGFQLNAIGLDYALILPPTDTPFASSHLLSTKLYLERLKRFKGKITP